MMPSFISLISLMVATMAYGKFRGTNPPPFAIILIAAVIQTAITFYDLYTMEPPTP